MARCRWRVKAILEAASLAIAEFDGCSRERLEMVWAVLRNVQLYMRQ